jgi:hypothetical protein
MRVCAYVFVRECEGEGGGGVTLEDLVQRVGDERAEQNAADDEPLFERDQQPSHLRALSAITPCALHGR